MAAPDPSAFAVQRAEVREGVELAFVREGVGGYPIVLLHGYPETMRIWWRNIGPLAEAGFEVIVPDLRGYGLSGFAPDEFYDVAAFGRDVHALVSDVLGHERCSGCGGDVGGAVLIDMGSRLPGFLERQVIFNTVLPVIAEEYEKAGIDTKPTPVIRQAADYFLRQGSDAEGLAAELDTAEKRRRYIGAFYGSRFWAAPGAFSPEEVDFMTEPFADAETLRSSWGVYEGALGAREMSEVPYVTQPCPVETLCLYGPEDHVIWRDFPERAEIAFPDVVGPFVVPGAGHFLQWERAELLNRALASFLRDRTA